MAEGSFHFMVIIQNSLLCTLLKGVICGINALLELYDELKSEGFEFLLTHKVTFYSMLIIASYLDWLGQ